MLLDVDCPQHGRQEVFSRHTPVSLACPICGGPAHRVWSSGATARVDFRDGWDMGAGRYFDTKRERDRWLQETGSTRIRD